MKYYKCKHCEREVTRRTTAKTDVYCSNACQRLEQSKDFKAKLLAGDLHSRPTLRKHLIEIEGHYCHECGGKEWMGQTIPLELDHKDGNPGNNEYTNLRTLCPNCHALTHSWKGRNRGKGRKTLGIPLF